MTFFKRRYLRQAVPLSEVLTGAAILLLTGGLWVAFVRDVSAAKVAGRSDDLFPSLDSSDWSAAQDVAVFTPQTLYEKIDGAADAYLQYGFVRLTFARYVRSTSSNADIQVSLYDMTTVENAKAIYDEEAPPKPRSLSVGDAAYRSGASVFFRKGQMYVQIMTDDESLEDLSSRLAEMIASRI